MRKSQLKLRPGTLKVLWIKLLWAAAALTLSTTVSAVGMGGINVTSALGQPLKAEIELVAVGKSEKASLVARLASPEAYKTAGLEYPFGNKFKFQIESRADGEPYLTVSSAQPINDPFVTMLVELTWSSGKLLREYTFLLDPPGYVPEQPAQAVVQPVAPVVQAAASAVPAAPSETSVASGVPVVTAETAAISGVPVVTVETAAPSGVPAVAAEAAAASAVPAVPEQAAAKPAAVEPVTGSAATGSIAIPANKEWLVVQRGDTMTKIAAQYKLADISLERMLVALYRANIDEFDGKNMNRIRAGKILHLPKQEELANVEQSDAKREIRAQAADWNVYRQKLASAAAVSRETQAAQQIATGKISSSVSDKAPVAKESAREVLKLSKGEAPGDQVATGAGGKAASAQDKAAVTAQDRKNAAQEDAIAKARAAKEEQMRTAMLEKNLQDMQRLAQLKSEAAALAHPPIEATSKVVVAASMIASPIAAASEVAAVSAVKPAPVAKPKPTEAAPEPSLVDQILDEPLYLAAGVAALLVLAGLGLLLKRRKKKPSFKDVGEQDSGGTSEDAGPVSGRMTAPVMPSPETGDFTRKPAAKTEAASQADNVDPISEADLFLNFGRDAQAEEILKEALKSTPNNHQIHLKLLGIYANRKDANSFAAIARELQNSGNEYAWKEAVAMGRELEPNNPLYAAGSMTDAKENSGATRQTTAFNATPAQTPDNTPAKPASGLDFDFDLGALSGKATPSPEQNFLGDADKTVIMSAGDMTAIQQPSTMDFDVTASSPAVPAAGEPAAAPNLDELIFDVTGSHPAMPAAQPEAAKPAPADDGAMEFTMDFPTAKPAPAAKAAEAGLAGISLDLGETAAPGGSAAGGRDDRWQEVATKLDLAKAYQEMGDADGVREILAEVLSEGDAEQQEAAKSMLKQLS